jgi:hypothetical protein
VQNISVRYLQNTIWLKSESHKKLKCARGEGEKIVSREFGWVTT